MARGSQGERTAHPEKGGIAGPRSIVSREAYPSGIALLAQKKAALKGIIDKTYFYCALIFPNIYAS